MLKLLYVSGWLWFFIILSLSTLFIINSFVERKFRAALRGILIFMPVLAGVLFLLLIEFPAKNLILSGVVILFTAFCFFLILPLGSTSYIKICGKQERVDERDALFHRFYSLVPGSESFEAYYRDHPENMKFDETVRKLPKLGHQGSRSHDPVTSLYQMSIFDVIKKINTDLKSSPEPVDGRVVHLSPEEFTSRIKGFARYLGADLVGVTRLNRAYVYSHIARLPGRWGEAVELNHSNAIVIAVEMRYEMVQHAPDVPAITETADRYFDAGKVASILARFIQLLGYEALAHIDGNYRVMCIPIAVDAGLGELGRLGLLVTPQFGPRVRLSVVTTNLPLIYDKPIKFGVQDFCEICKKCAENCPSGSVDSGEKKIYRGVEKWKSEQNSCYKFWRIQGTDCSICIRVCPFSHPGTIIHNGIRWIISRNKFARRIALIGDNLFYGRNPSSKFPLQDWHKRSLIV